MNLALNNLVRLICHKIQINKQTNQTSFDLLKNCPCVTHCMVEGFSKYVHVFPKLMINLGNLTIFQTVCF